MKRHLLLFSVGSLLVATAQAQNSFHFSSREEERKEDIGVSSGVLTIGKFVDNCEGRFPANIDWKEIMVGIGTPSPTEQLHTTQGVRFEGLTQDDAQRQVLVQDGTGKLFWRDAGTLGGGGTTGDFWSLNGNAIAAGQFFGTTNNIDVVFKRNNTRAGLLGLNNTAFGVAALNISTGKYNTAIGDSTLAVSTTANYNTACGYSALRSITTGLHNTAVGAFTLTSSTTGVQNTAVGMYSLNQNTTGSLNTAVGARCLEQNMTGGHNTACGQSALQDNTSGFSNLALGCLALGHNISGSHNTANGVRSLFGNISGNNNIAIGDSSLIHSLTGNNNTAIGYQTAGGIISGSSNTIIGANVGVTTPLPATLSNTIIIADGDGTQRLYIDDAGHAGLATTTPTAALHVNCTGIPLTGASNVRFENLQPGRGHILVIDDDGYVKRASESTAGKMAPQEDMDAIKAELATLKAQMAVLMAAQDRANAVSGNIPASSLDIVPTPFSDHAKVIYTIAGFKGSAALQVTDANGVLLQTIPLASEKGAVELDNIKSGVVLVSIVVEGKILVSKRSVKL